MKTNRKLQIDVIGEEPECTGFVKCKIYIDGRSCIFWTTDANYQALMYDGVFIRNGKTRDSAGVINTTRTFIEEE